MNPARGRLVVLGIGGSGGWVEVDRDAVVGRVLIGRLKLEAPTEKTAQTSAQIVHRSVGQRDVSDGLRTLRDHV